MKTNRWLYGFFPGFLVFFPAVLLFCTDPVMAAGQVQTQAESEGLIPAGRTDFVYAQCVEIQEYEKSDRVFGVLYSHPGDCHLLCDGCVVFGCGLHNSA